MKGEKADRSWKCINRPQIHKCENWYCGRAIPFLGIFVLNFRYFQLSILRKVLFFLIEGLENFLCDYSGEKISRREGGGRVATARNYINVKNTLRLRGRQTKEEPNIVEGLAKRRVFSPFRSDPDPGPWLRTIG